MSEWSAGYVSDIGYTFGYYNELNPLRARLALLNAGLACPEFRTACELGFGQGLSTNTHAAASSTHWHGTDFNPSQAGFAQELARASGADVHVYDEAFADFAHRPDLPDFDFIGLHGIWSWISDENRSVIADFVRRKLKVGGVLYVSYNTMPGWAGFAPMRHLMTEHAQLIGAEGHGIVSRIDGALAFSEKLLATNPAYARANPQIAERLRKLKEQNRHYVAHEYFNRDWHPMHVATMTKWLEPAKVSYACPAHYLDHVDSVNLTAQQQDFLKEIPDAMLRESVRDFMVNQQFRRDYWIKGPRRLSSVDQLEALRAQRLVMIAHRPDIALKVTGALGEAKLADEIYNPILDFLADHRPRTLAEIEQTVRANGVAFAQAWQAVLLLCGAGYLTVAQADSEIAKAAPATARLNKHLIQRARGSNDINHLASPVTGGAVGVARINQLFLLAEAQGGKKPAEWARAVWQILSAQGQKLVKEGKTLETAEENLAELTAQAISFAGKQLPVAKALRIV